MSTLRTCKDGSEFETQAGLGFRKVMLDGVSPSVAPHRHAFPHDMVVVQGKVFATCDDVEHLLQPGDVLTVPATAMHSVRLCPCVDAATFFCIWPIGAQGYNDTTKAVL